MKYSEFNNELASLGMILQDFEVDIYILRNGVSVGKISKERRYMMTTNHASFKMLPEMAAAKLFEFMAFLSETPLAEREEEKRYYLRFAAPPLLKDLIPNNYVNIYRESNEVSLSPDRKDTEDFKTIFTESEIAQMDITGFEKIEVSE